jgi:hypothetical protein
MSAKSRRATLGGRKNRKADVPGFSKMTLDEQEEAILQLIESWGRSPPAKLARPKSIEGEAKRGARNARRFLAENPTQDEIQRAWEWTCDETDMGCSCPACLAYVEAYQRVLHPRLG